LGAFAPYIAVNILMKILLRGKNLLFPGMCVLCGGGLFEPEEIRLGLCLDCGSSFVPFEGMKCGVCGKPLISEQGTCLPCRNNPEHSYDRLWVLFPYTGKYRKLLTAYKFHKNLELASFFAKKINELIACEPLLKDACIVPVPPRPGKIKHSGWDQVEHLVKKLVKIPVSSLKSEYPVSRCLKRRKSKAQKQLNRTDRLDNLKDRIYITGAVPKKAVIIDDVITTGSTMEVCARVLKNAGAEDIYGICLFYD